MPRAKKTAAGKPKRSASNFIRSQPSDMTAPQVVEAGAKAGLKFSGNLVYAVRAAARKKKGTAGRTSAPRQGAASAEANLRRLVVELGITRSRALIGELENAIARVIRGG